MSLQAAASELVLASASASRRGLLTAAALRFVVHPADIDETITKRTAQEAGASPEDAALCLARLKAAAVAPAHPESLIIGCDQILVCEGRWFDKAASQAELRSQLEFLSGREHCLITAVVCRRDTVAWEHVDRSRLRMRRLTPQFLDTYLAQEGKAALQCVGGYRIEALGIHLFDEITGDHNSILGLPMLPLLKFLRKQGVVIA